MAEDYFDIADEFHQDVPDSADSDYQFLVSSTPGNLTYMGLNYRVFPYARFIHVKRDPLDNCLECYFKSFSSKAHAYSNNLDDLGFFYQQYQRVISHWRDIVGIPMLEIDYEELVADTDTARKKIFDYIGLEPSAETTEISFSTDRINRWKNYRDELQPLIEILGEETITHH